jgi:hypothetical protein
VTRLPREARDGLMRAWLEILKERHLEVSWIARDHPSAEAAARTDQFELVESLAPGSIRRGETGRRRRREQDAASR